MRVTKGQGQAEAAAGVRHHVALSIVGTDRSDNGYFHAKLAQEKLIKSSGIPYTIIRATQFMEFLGGIADSGTDGNTVRLSPSLFQPIAADDVAAVVAEVALAAPRNGIVEIAGPERVPFNELVARYLKAVGDPRQVVRDPEAGYWGGRVEERSLVPLGEAPRPHRFRRMAPPLTRRSLNRHTPIGGSGSMKRILYSLLVATLPFGSILADAPKSKNAKVTLVYQHELPNCPGKSIKGVLVEYGPGGYSPAHTHAKSAFIYATVLEGAIRSQVNDGPVKTYTAGESFSELPGDRHGVSANASETKPAKLLAVFVVDTNENGTDDPIRELRLNTFRAEVLRPLRPSQQVGTSGMMRRPFVWTASADSILAKLKRLCKVINGTFTRLETTTHAPCGLS